MEVSVMLLLRFGESFAANLLPTFHIGITFSLLFLSVQKELIIPRLLDLTFTLLLYILSFFQPIIFPKATTLTFWLLNLYFLLMFTYSKYKLRLKSL